MKTKRTTGVITGAFATLLTVVALPSNARLVPESYRLNTAATSKFDEAHQLAIGIHFGRTDTYSVALRARHTSNGGIDSANPGLDMIGLMFTVDFTREGEDRTTRPE